MAFAALPMLMMLLMPAWALLWQMFNGDSGWLWNQKYLLFAFGTLIMGLQIWMVIEAALMFPRAKGVLEKQLPPLTMEPALADSGGRSC